MSINPIIAEDPKGRGLLPVPQPGETLILECSDIFFKVTLPCSHQKLKGMGSFVLSTTRLVFLCKKRASTPDFKAFEIPLDTLEGTNFKQPAFGVNRLEGWTITADQDKNPGYAYWSLSFYSGGCDEVLPWFFQRMSELGKSPLANSTRTNEQSTCCGGCFAFICGRHRDDFKDLVPPQPPRKQLTDHLIEQQEQLCEVNEVSMQQYNVLIKQLAEQQVQLSEQKKALAEAEQMYDLREVSEQQKKVLMEKLAGQQAQIADQKKQLVDSAKALLSLKKRLFTSLDEQLIDPKIGQPSSSTSGRNHHRFRHLRTALAEKLDSATGSGISSNSSPVPSSSGRVGVGGPLDSCYIGDDPTSQGSSQEPTPQPGSKDPSDELAIRTSIRKLATATVMMKYCGYTGRALGGLSPKEVTPKQSRRESRSDSKTSLRSASPSAMEMEAASHSKHLPKPLPLGSNSDSRNSLLSGYSASRSASEMEAPGSPESLEASDFLQKFSTACEVDTPEKTHKDTEEKILSCHKAKDCD